MVEAAPSEATAIISILTGTAEEDEYLSVRRAAVEALKSVAPTATREVQKIIPSLLKAAKDRDQDVRLAARKALKKVVETAPGEATAITQTLIKDTEDQYSRQAAIEALGSVAPVARRGWGGVNASAPIEVISANKF